ncbi:MAG: hypothetical protein IPK16_13270 [Anaerolineales bacterium]|nr:hypothetical protein [Anaerolineales bacterium]
MDTCDCQVRLSIADSAVYHIELQGALEPSWTEAIDGMNICHQNADGTLITTLRGTVADQAALAGVLNLAFMLGLPVLSVQCVGRVGPE